MNSLATSVVSAAVIGGELILGLSDGSIINAGFVQGPQGLKGDQGPMGATGRSGTDGNTIHTVAGAPDTTLGKDGDYAINTTVWEIYGPRSGGVWGAGTPLRGNKRGEVASKDPIFGMQSGSGDRRWRRHGQTYTTGNLPLGHRPPDRKGRPHLCRGNIIPLATNLRYQSNLNLDRTTRCLRWTQRSRQVDTLPPQVIRRPPWSLWPVVFTSGSGQLEPTESNLMHSLSWPEGRSR